MMRILNRADIHALVDVAGLVPAIREAMRRVSEGKTDMPLRNMIRVGGPNLFGIMTGAMREPDVHGAKLLSLYPNNPSLGRSSHCGVEIIFDAATGLPAACIDAAELTAIRTAAATAVATDALARPGPARLALIGCGEQAHSHIAAMRAVRPISSIVVWGRDRAKAAAFGHENGTEVAPSIEAAVADADIVCTTTPSTTPLLQKSMLRPGLHINAVGASIPTMQEIATTIVPAVTWVTDYRPSLEAQAAEIIDARRQGLVPPDFSFTEIGEVLNRTRPGRTAATDITLYRSLGVAAQDLAGAMAILDLAKAAGRGVEVDWS
jgi:ornithine cyclodeaminase